MPKERSVSVYVFVGGGWGGGSDYTKSLYSGSLAVLAKLWSSVMWRFTVKKSPRGCGKLQLYQAVFGFYLFGGSLLTLRDCRLLGDCEEIVKVECILLYILLYCLYSERVSATRRHDPVSRNAYIKWNPFCSWAELTRPPEADKIRKRSRETGAPIEKIVENHLNIALFRYLNGRYRHIFIT